MLARQVAARPEPSRYGLHLFGVRRLGHQHHERRQVLIQRTESVRSPGAQARPASDLVARLHIRDCRFVVDSLRMHAADEAHVVDHLGRVRQQLRDPHARLPVLGELEFARCNREPLLAGGHGGQALPLANRVGQVLIVPLIHLRLIVVQVHLRRTADHVQVNHMLGFRREVRERRVRRFSGQQTAGAFTAQQRG